MCDSTQNTVYCAPRTGADMRWLTYYYDQVHNKSTELSKAVSGEWDRPRYCPGCQKRESRVETMKLLHSLTTHTERLKSGIQWKTGENKFGEDLQDLKVVWSSLNKSVSLEEGNTTQSAGSLHFALHCGAIGGGTTNQKQKADKDACEATHLGVRAIWFSLRETYALFYGVVSLFASGKDSNDLCKIPALLFRAASGSMTDDESLIHWSAAEIQTMIECLTLELSKKAPGTPDTTKTTAHPGGSAASSIRSQETYNTIGTEP